MVTEKKEQLLSKEELCEQKGKKVFLLGKKKSEKMVGKKIKVHISSFFQ